MGDAAAFFANKKKKKKTFKFNANKIDASTITSTVHVDAPALSNNADVPSTGAALSSLTVGNDSSPLSSTDPASTVTNGGDDEAQWDDEALAAKTSRKGMAVAVPFGVTTKELAETKALALKTNTSGNEQEDIAEKLRVEETRAKLAAAREGMEREAQRIKEEKEKKELEATNSRFGNAAAGLSSSAAGGGGKWVPSRLRVGGEKVASGGWGTKSSHQKKVDTEDENLFPDLSAADAILEKQKQEQSAFKAPKKVPAGGGATWGASTAPATRPKLNLKKKTPIEPPKVEEESPANGGNPSKIEETPTVVEEVKSVVANPALANEEPALASPPAESCSPADAAPAPIKPKKKKKKKDISTFNAKK